MPARATAETPGDRGIIADIVAQQVAASYVAALGGMARARLATGSPIGKAASPVPTGDGHIPDRKRTEAVRNERRNAGGQWTATGGGPSAKPDGEEAQPQGESPEPGDADAGGQDAPVTGGSPEAGASGQAATGVFDGAGQDFRTRAKALMDQDLQRGDLSGANLSGMDMSGEALRFTNFSNATMVGTDLRRARLNDANLSGADLTQARLGSASLAYANLSGANLSGARLGSADLRYANLSGANLTGADLYDTTLGSADFGGANLTGTEFLGAGMDGANFAQAYTVDALGNRQPFTPPRNIHNRAPSPPVAAVEPMAAMAAHAWPATPGITELERDYPPQSLDVNPDRYRTTMGDAWGRGLGLRDGVRPLAPGRGIVQHIGPVSGIRTVAFQVGDADDEHRAPFAITQWTRDGAELGVYRSYPQESLAPPGAPGSGPHPVNDPAETAPTYDQAYRRSMQLAAWAEAQFEQARTPEVKTVGGKRPKGYARALAARDEVTLDLYSPKGGSGPPAIEFDAPFGTPISRRPLETAMFGRPLRPAEYGEMVGAINGATVTVSLGAHGIHIGTEHPFYTNKRSFRFENGTDLNQATGGTFGTDTPPFDPDDSVLVCENLFFRATDEAPGGLASRVLGMQVRKLMVLGAAMLRVHGVGDRKSNMRGADGQDDDSGWSNQQDWSGYTVWPKLGFQAAFTDDLRQMCEDRRSGAREPERHAPGVYRLSDLPPIRYTDEDGNAIEDDGYDDDSEYETGDTGEEEGYADVDPPDGLAQITDFNTLHATEQGRAYWEEYGEEHWWHFDLRKASKQRAILDAYLKRKRINLGPEPV